MRIALLGSWVRGGAALWFGMVASLRGQSDGTVLWAYTTLSSATAGAVVSSPAVDENGVVYFGLEIGSETSLNPTGRVVALNSDGTLKWATAISDWVDGSPLLGRDGTSLYVGSWNGKFYALDRATGSVLWSYATDSFISGSAAQGPDGTLYVGAGDGFLHTLSESGAVKWIFPTSDWIQASPTVAPDGVVYVGSWDNALYALTPTGELLWSVETGGDVVSSAAVAADGMVVFGSRDRNVYAVNLDGSLRWSWATGDGVEASPIIGPDGTVYVGSTSGVFYAINADGVVRWSVDLGAAIYSTAALRADGTVVVGASDYKVHALSATGQKLWAVTTGDWVDSSPVVTESGRIYVGGYDKKLYAISGGAGIELGGDWPQLQRSANRDGWQVRGSTNGATGRLINMSVRSTAGAGSETLVAGFVVGGEGSRTMLLRGVGPTLTAYGLSGTLVDPEIKIYGGDGAQIGGNDNWGDAPDAAATASSAQVLGAFPLMDGSLDAATLTTFAAGPSSVHVTGTDGGTGLALVEAYDAGGDAGARLVNLSARSQVGTGADVLIAGFVIDETMTLLVRGVGPALTPYGVEGVLADPVVQVVRGGRILAQSNDAATASDAVDVANAAAVLGAFLLPAGGKDAALIVTLPAGAYSAVVKGTEGGTGVALVELYVVKP